MSASIGGTLARTLITDGRSKPGAQKKNDVKVKRYPSEAVAMPKKKAKATQ